MALEKAGLIAVLEGAGEYILTARRLESANAGLAGSFANTAGGGNHLIASLAKVGIAILGVTTAIGVAAVGKASGYQTILAQIDALTNTSTEDTEKLGKAILQMAREIPKSPEELGSAAYFVLSSGINDVGQALDVVRIAAKASAAGLGETKQVADVLTSVINAYGAANITAAQASDILVATVREGKGEATAFAQAIGLVIPIASAAGVKFDEVGALLATMTNTGASAAEAVTQLRGILVQLISPSDKAKETLSATGAFTSVMSESFVAGTATALQLKDAELKVAEAQKKLNDVLKDHKKESLEAQRASVNLTKAQEALAAVQSKSTGSVVRSADAFASLRKEIQEKGLIPTLFKLQEAFKGDEEGLANIFPDVRGFIGFLSAIQTQGSATTAILERIRGAAGITDEAFRRMNETTAAQVQLLKNQLNVALIELGSKALPYVTSAVQAAIKEWPKLEDVIGRVAHLLGSGFKGNQIGGEFSIIERAAFGVGKALGDVYDLISKNKGTVVSIGATELLGLVTVLQALKDVGGWIISNQVTLVAAITAIGLAFAWTNPVTAALLGAGGIIFAIGLLRSNINDLPIPLLRARAELDKLILGLFDFRDTVLTLGLNKIFNFSLAPGDKAKFSADLAGINDLLHNQEDALRAVAQASQQAARAGVPLDKFLEDTFNALSTLGPGFGDTAVGIGRLITAYDQLHGGAGAALRDFPGLQKAVDLLGVTAPPTAAALEQLGRAAEAGAVGTATLATNAALAADPVAALRDTAASTAEAENAMGGSATSASQAIEGLGGRADATESSISRLLRKTQEIKDAFEEMKRRADEALRAAQDAIASERELEGPTGPGHAHGGIFYQEHTARIAEHNLPEAIIPLTNPARAQQILQATGLVSSAAGGAGGRGSVSTLSSMGQWAGGRMAVWSGGGGAGWSLGGGGSGGGLSFGGQSRPVQAVLPAQQASLGGGSGGGGINISVMGATSRETEMIAVRAVRQAFAQARSQAGRSGALLTTGLSSG